MMQLITESTFHAILLFILFLSHIEDNEDFEEIGLTLLHRTESFLKSVKYMRTSLFVVLVFRVLTIRGLLFDTCFTCRELFTCLFSDFGKICNPLPYFAVKITVFMLVNLPLLSAVFVFGGYFWNETSANNEG